MSAAPAQATAGGWGTPAALLVGAALLLGATVAWPGMTVVPREARSRAAAAALLAHVATAERDWARAHGGYAALEPDGTLRGAAPAAPVAGSDDFQLDALPQPDGGLRLRVLGRPEAVGAGRVFPVLLDTVLPVAGSGHGGAR